MPSRKPYSLDEIKHKDSLHPTLGCDLYCAPDYEVPFTSNGASGQEMKARTDDANQKAHDDSATATINLTHRPKSNSPYYIAMIDNSAESISKTDARLSPDIEQLLGSKYICGDPLIAEFRLVFDNCCATLTWRIVVSRSGNDTPGELIHYCISWFAPQCDEEWSNVI